jgi:CRP-like cAMP-binding protein
MPAAALREGGRWNWFSELPDEVFVALCQHSTLLRLEQAGSVYRRGDKAAASYQVLRGRVHMRTYSSGGKELLYLHMEPGDCFGELGLLDGKACHHDADADAGTELLSLPAAVFHELRARHREIDQALLQLLAQRSRAAYETIEGAILRDVPHRLARRLQELFAGNQAADGALACSHDELARMIGSSRQSVTAIIKGWERQGWLEQAYGQIRLLDAASLASFADD